MQIKKYKRIVLCFLAVLAAASLLTAGVLAAETEEDTLIAGYQAEIDRILTHYLGSTTMPEEKILEKVDAMDWETYQTARWEISLLAAEICTAIDNKEIPVENLYPFGDANKSFVTFTSALEEKNTRDNPIETYATASALGGHISITNNGGSFSGTRLKASGGFGSSATTTATATVKNETTDKKITYTYKFDSGNNHLIDGAKADATTGTHTLLPGQSKTYTFTTGGWFASAYVEFSGFSEVTLETGYNVTFLFSEGTLTVDGESVTSGGSVNVATAGEHLVASATNIVGWINTADNSIIPIGTGKTNNFSLKVDSAVTLKAIHSTEPRFFLGNDYLYESLSAAIAAASATNAPSKTIILANSGTLPVVDGGYTIPSGVTLLIPFDDGNTLITNDMGNHVNTNYSSPPAPTLYRQLTMPSGASITVNGALAVGSQALNLMRGQVGPYGSIVMDEGSNIVVENGGNLYAYGYIFYGKGNGGTVTIKNGGTVYESGFIMDYPGNVSNTDELQTGTGIKVFPVRNITVRNVEVPMTLSSGAIEKVFYCVYGTVLGGNLPGYIDFVGNTTGSAFCLNSGATLTKSYADGRQYYGLSGNISINSLDITMKYLGFSHSANSSSTSGFPICSNYDIEIASGTLTLNDNIICLEGSTMTIAENATVNTNGKKLYVLDADDDPGAMWADGDKNQSLWNASVDVHGTQYGRVDTDAVLTVNGTLNVSGGLYTSAGKASIISTGNGKIVFTSASVTDTTVNIRYGRGYRNEGDAGYTTLNVTSAYLQNVDGTFVETKDAATATYTYRFGFWNCPAHDWTGNVYRCKNCHTPLIQYNALTLNIESEILLNLKYVIQDDISKVCPRAKVYVTEEANNVVKDGVEWERLISEAVPEAERTESNEFVLEEDETTKEVRYVVSEGIAAGEMTGDVKVVFKDAAGNPIPFYNKDTKAMVVGDAELIKHVTDFAKAAKDNNSERNIKLSQGALTFGGYAQQFYKTDATNPAYTVAGYDALSLNGVDSLLAAVPQTSFSGNTGVNATSQKLNLDSRIYIRTYFTLPTKKTQDDYTITITRPENKGTEYVSVDGDWGTENGRLYVDISNVPPAYWDNTYIITITEKANSSNTYQMRTSVLAWCARCVNASEDNLTGEALNQLRNQKNMARAMYLYCQEANTYFDQTFGQDPNE